MTDKTRLKGFKLQQRRLKLEKINKPPTVWIMKNWDGLPRG